jgi:SAM-dependent methyltransferase
MSGAPQPRTLDVHGHLWGAQARDWADFMEGTCRPVFEAALDRTGVGPGTRYLDLGCGTGMAAAIAAARGADVCGLDAAEGMLSIARERVANGDFRRGDLEDLPFADDTFDVVTGVNAFQYAGNPVAALGEARRVTKRDGRIVVAVFGNPEGMGAATLITALAPLLPPRPPGTPGPFALSDEDALRSFATEAGLEPIEVFDVDSPWIYADETAAMRGLSSTGNAVRAMENTSAEAVAEVYARALVPFRRPDGSYHASAWFRCLLARPR